MHRFLGVLGIATRHPFENWMFAVLKSFQSSPWRRSSDRFPPSDTMCFHCQHLIYPPSRMSTFSRIVRNNWWNLCINSFKSFSYSEPFVCPIPKNIRRLSILRRVPDETLPDLPMPAPKRFKRSAPEPEEPPAVQEVPKAELTGKIREDGDEITDKREEIKQWTEMTTKCRHNPIPLIWYFTISTPNPLILACFSIGSIPFAVPYGDYVCNIPGSARHAPGRKFRKRDMAYRYSWWVGKKWIEMKWNAWNEWI